MSADISDVPIPSVETDFQQDRVTPSRAAPRTAAHRFQTPPVSITPPSAAPTVDATRNEDRNGSSGARDSVPGATRSGTVGLTGGLANMRLSPVGGIADMTILGEAVDAAARGSDSRANSLTPSIVGETPGPDTPRSRRRSNSQVDRARHEISDEEPPPDAVHSPQFQRAFREAKRLMSDMETVLGSSTLHTEQGSTIRRLHQEGVELASFQYPSSRTVGFVGDSGVGKSSLLNSLLDTEGLARTSNSGEACTCVVTEYHYHDRDTFDIQVDLFTTEDLSVQLKSMLQSYRHFHRYGDEMDEAERSDFEANANVAIDTFRAMFRGRLSNEAFLIENEEDAVLETLSTWAAEARPSPASTQHSSLPLQACSTTLMQLSSEPPSRNQPATWPYIRNIKVFSNAHILSTGLILVDLPGLRDKNAARRLITERYLINCNEIFAVCNIGRAVTDAGVNDIFELARRARLSNVGIICTRSEETKAEEAIGDFSGDKVTTIKRMITAIDTDKRDEDEVQGKIDVYEIEDNEEELSADEEQDLRDLEKQMRRIKEPFSQSRRRKSGHEFELQNYLVKARNESVSRQLRSLYNRSVSDQQIKVFCVSNTVYWGNRNDSRNKALPYLKLSGILETRKHCLSIVASSQRRAAKRYMNDQIPGFLAQVDLWVQSGARTASEERREAIRRTLDDVESQLNNVLSSRNCQVSRVSASGVQEFADLIYERACPCQRGPFDNNFCNYECITADTMGQGEISHHGVGLPETQVLNGQGGITVRLYLSSPGSDVLKALKHIKATYSAFCRNYGNHSTPAVGAHNWNEEAITTMVADLDTPWEELCSALEEIQDNMLQVLEEVADSALETLESNFDDDSAATTALIKTLSTHQRLLLDAVEQAHEQFEADLDVVRIDAFSGIRSSLIGRAMEPAYRSCMQESDRGSDSRRKGIITSTLSNQAIFQTLMQEFRAAFRTRAEENQKRISNAVTSYLDVAQVNFDLMRSENAVRESEQDPDFRDRVSDAVQESRDELGRIQSAIDV